MEQTASTRIPPQLQVGAGSRLKLARGLLRSSGRKRRSGGVDALQPGCERLSRGTATGSFPPSTDAQRLRVCEVELQHQHGASGSVNVQSPGSSSPASQTGLPDGGAGGVGSSFSLAEVTEVVKMLRCGTLLSSSVSKSQRDAGPRGRAPRCEATERRLSFCCSGSSSRRSP
ncbi:unnamed protein product [Pleuronectes platessa]|uniref:Uncharacterized protein n=1 Tax=Pleuronectes platessa TaxID=8262 RepID=A0A9N7V1Q8_PLEPL|nr:unnamed protein product [Pleuronectes platessa]